MHENGVSQKLKYLDVVIFRVLDFRVSVLLHKIFIS